MFDLLADEVLVYIFEDITETYLATIMKVCKRFKSIVDDIVSRKKLNFLECCQHNCVLSIRKKSPTEIERKQGQAILVQYNNLPMLRYTVEQLYDIDYLNLINVAATFNSMKVLKYLVSFIRCTSSLLFLESAITIAQENKNNDMASYLESLLPPQSRSFKSINRGC